MTVESSWYSRRSKEEKFALAILIILVVLGPAIVVPILLTGGSSDDSSSDVSSANQNAGDVPASPRPTKSPVNVFAPSMETSPHIPHTPQQHLPTNKPSKLVQTATPSVAPITSAPITDAPVAPAPATSAPVTNAPVTDAPFTPAPVTDAPVTLAPVTDAPTTLAPVTDAPTTLAPVTDAPTTPAPVTPEPSAAPVTSAPTIPTLVHPVGSKFLLLTHKTLRSGHAAYLPSFDVFLELLNDGNLVLYRSATPHDDNDTPLVRAFSRDDPEIELIWELGMSGEIMDYFAIMQGNGDFLIRKGTPEVQGELFWKSGTGQGYSGNFNLGLSGSGMVITNDDTGEIIWDTTEAGKSYGDGALFPTVAPTVEVLDIIKQPYGTTHFLVTGQVLLSGQAIYLPEYHTYLELKKNGNLILYQQFAENEDVDEEAEIHMMWELGMPGSNGKYYAIMQGNGDFLIWQGTPEKRGKLVWKSDTPRGSGSYTLGLTPSLDGMMIFNAGTDTSIWDIRDAGIGYEHTPMYPTVAIVPTVAPSPLPPGHTYSPTESYVIPPTTFSSRVLLVKDQVLQQGQSVYLPKLNVRLLQEDSGNLIFFEEGKENNPIWESGVNEESGQYFTWLQPNGDLVTRTGTPQSNRNEWKLLWQSNNALGDESFRNYRLVVSEDVTGLETVRGNDFEERTWSTILISGPLVGHTTEDSVQIWALAEEGRTIELTYQREGSNDSTTIDMPQRRQHSFSSLIEITGLEDSTRYTFEIHVDGVFFTDGEFKTAPKPNVSLKFSYLLTSCMNPRKGPLGFEEQPVWDAVLDKKPDFAFFNGDTIYMTHDDWDDDGPNGFGTVRYDRVLFRNFHQRREVHFAKFIRSVPIYMVWDDHEYGKNDAFEDQPGKENALAGMKALWANPSYGLEDIHGMFYTYFWGDVQFFALDCRWYRKKNKQSQFGDAQKEWLYNELLKSTAPFKVIISGYTITAMNDLVEIGKFVTQNGISGIVFQSGDTHKNEFMTIEHQFWPYNVTQITSSGIARDQWLRTWSIVEIDTTLNDPVITTYFYGADNKNKVTTWSNEPDSKCTDIEPETNYLGEANFDDFWRIRTKTSRCTQTIRLSDLTP